MNARIDRKIIKNIAIKEQSVSAPTIKKQIVEESVTLLASQPDGIRFTALKNLLAAQLPAIKVNNIPAVLVQLEKLAPEAVYKPVKGLFRHTRFRELTTSLEQPSLPEPQVQHGPKESDFYQPFASWLVGELEDCTRPFPWEAPNFRINGVLLTSLAP